MKGRFLGGAVEGAPQRLAIYGDNTLDRLGEFAHEDKKAGVELHGIDKAEDAAERVVARNAVPQCQELAEERLFRPAKQSHVRAIFSPAQDRAKRDHQQFEEIVTGVVVARILQIRKARKKYVHGPLPRSIPWFESCSPASARPSCTPKMSNAIPLVFRVMGREERQLIPKQRSISEGGPRSGLGLIRRYHMKGSGFPEQRVARPQSVARIVFFTCGYTCASQRRPANTP